MVTPVDYFGGNSDGSARMFDWIDSYCPGCRFSQRKFEREEGMAGYGCDLVTQAFLNPYDDLEQWSPDAGNDPHELTCMAREGRPASPWKGVRRGPRQAAGQVDLFGGAA